MKIEIELTDVETGPTANSWTALEAGDYRVAVTGSDIRETANGAGTGMLLFINVLGTETELREWLNIKHKNPTAEAIAKKRVAEILDAVGIARDAFTDTSMIEGKPFMAAIGRRRMKDDERREKYGDRNGDENYIKYFGPIPNGNDGVAKQVAPTIEPTAVAVTETSPLPSADDDIPF